MELTAQRVIARPAPEVFAFFADATNNPAWQRGMKSCKWTTPEPIAVGSRYRQDASFLGRPVVSVFEVRELVPGSRIVIETIESTFPIRVERIVEAIDAESCRVAAVIVGGPKVPRFAQRLLGWMAQRSVNRDYDRLVETLGT